MQEHRIFYDLQPKKTSRIISEVHESCNLHNHFSHQHTPFPMTKMYKLVQPRFKNVRKEKK